MTATRTIRVPTASHARLRRLASEEARPIGRVIDALHDDFIRLQADPEAWADYQAEWAAWDATLRDGLADDRWEG